MNFKNRDIISIRDFSKEELLHVIKVARTLEKRDHSSLLKDKLMASLFFEPSTRTRLSFESAMNQLGGKVIGFAEAGVSSAAKGETLYDSIKVIEGYCDVIVMRHPIEGTARVAAEAASIPVINGGDGANQHPTQTMLDLFTIQKEKGTLENLYVGFLGDLKYGRTVHSLALALTHFNAKMCFIAPQALQMPEEELAEIKAKGINYTMESEVQNVIKDLDVLYVTRIQKERFPDPLDYERVKGIYRITPKTLEGAKKDLKILHPLPRVNELSPSVDKTKSAVYFDQAWNGVTVRKALLGLVLGKLK